MYSTRPCSQVQTIAGIRARTHIWVRETACLIRPKLHLVGQWAAQTCRVRASTRSWPPPLYPHFNRPSGFWSCVKPCLVGDIGKYNPPLHHCIHLISFHKKIIERHVFISPTTSCIILWSFFCHFLPSRISVSFFNFQCIRADLMGDEGILYVKNIFAYPDILLTHNNVSSSCWVASMDFPNSLLLFVNRPSLSGGLLNYILSLHTELLLISSC